MDQRSSSSLYVWRAFAAAALCLWIATAGLARAAGPSGRADVVGPFRFPAPAGWTRTEPKGQKGRTVVYTSPDSAGDRQATLTVSVAPLNGADFKKSFQAVVDKWLAGRAVLSALDNTPVDDQGYEARTCSVMLQGGVDAPSAEFFGLHVGNDMVTVRYSCTIQPTEQNHFDVSVYRKPYEALLAGYQVADGKPAPGAPLAAGTPPLTDEVAARWVERYEWAMGLKLAAADRQKVIDALTAAWKAARQSFGGDAANAARVAELDQWRAEASSPANAKGAPLALLRLRWRTRLWLDLCRQEGPSEMAALLAADAAAHPERYAHGMLRPAPAAPAEDQPLPAANAEAYGDYIEWLCGLKLSPDERRELARHMEVDRHSLPPGPAGVRQAMDFWSRLTRLSPADRAMILATNQAGWMQLLQGSSFDVDRYTVQLIHRQRPPLAVGGQLEPSLWQESVTAYVALFCRQASLLHGGKAAFEPSAQVVADAGRELAAHYAEASRRRKLGLSEMPQRLAELDAIWPGLSDADRRPVLDAWAKWYAPLHLSSPQPAVAAGDSAALMRWALEADRKEDEAWKASPAARQWEQRRYATLSQMEANRHQATMMMIAPGHYELQWVPSK